MYYRKDVKPVSSLEYLSLISYAGMEKKDVSSEYGQNMVHVKGLPSSLMTDVTLGQLLNFLTCENIDSSYPPHKVVVSIK